MRSGTSHANGDQYTNDQGRWIVHPENGRTDQHVSNGPAAGRCDDCKETAGNDVEAGTILIHTLAEASPDLVLGGIFLLAAPFVGEGGWPSEDITPMSGLRKKFSAQTPVYLYHGSEDQTVPFEHVHLYARVIPQAVVRRLTGRDHQLNNDLSEVAADIQRAWE